MMVNTKKMTDVPRMPIMKPHLAIAAVALVPRSCRSVMTMKMTSTPRNLTHGTLLSAAHPKISDTMPMMK